MNEKERRHRKTVRKVEEEEARMEGETEQPLGNLRLSGGLQNLPAREKVEIPRALHCPRAKLR